MGGFYVDRYSNATLSCMAMYAMLTWQSENGTWF